MALVLVSIAFMVRLLGNLYLIGVDQPGFGAFSGGDVLEYDALGWSLAKGEGYSTEDGPNTFRPPGYPAFLALIYLVFGHSYMAVKVTQSVLGALTCFMIFKLGEHFFTKRVGAIAAGIAAVYPLLIVYTGVLLSETLFVCLSMVFLYLLTRVPSRDSFWPALLAGVVLGVMNLTRPVALLLPAFLFIWGLYIFPDKRRSVVLISTLVASMLVVILPWTLRNYVVTRSFLLVSAHHWGTLYGANNPNILKNPEAIGGWIQPPEGMDYRTEYISFMKTMMFEQPLELVRLELHKLKRFWNVLPKTSDRDRILSLLSYGLLLPLCAIGVVLSWNCPQKPWILFMWVLYFNFIAILFHGSTRYRLPVEPTLILFGAFALDRLYASFVVRGNDRNCQAGT